MVTAYIVIFWVGRGGIVCVSLIFACVFVNDPLLSCSLRVQEPAPPLILSPVRGNLGCLWRLSAREPPFSDITTNLEQSPYRIRSLRIYLWLRKTRHLGAFGLSSRYSLPLGIWKMTIIFLYPPWSTSADAVARTNTTDCSSTAGQKLQPEREFLRCRGPPRPSMPQQYATNTMAPTIFSCHVGSIVKLVT